VTHFFKFWKSSHIFGNGEDKHFKFDVLNADWHSRVLQRMRDRLPRSVFFYFGSQNLFNLCKITDDILETAQGTPSPVHPVTTLLSFGARWWRRCLESVIRISRKIVDRFLLKRRQTARPGTRNNWPDFGPRSSGRIVLCCIVLSPEVAGRPPVQAIYRSLFISSCCNRHFLKRSTLTCSWTAAVPGRSCV